MKAKAAAYATWVFITTVLCVTTYEACLVPYETGVVDGCNQCMNAPPTRHDEGEPWQ